MTRFLTLAACILLLGCGPQPLTKRPSKYATEPNVATFNGWAVLGCQAFIRGTDITLQTNGNVEEYRLRLTLEARRPFLRPPRLLFTAGDLVAAPEGAGATYAFEVPYTPYVASQLGQPMAYLTVTYQLREQPGQREHFFPLSGLPPALAYMDQQGCTP
jgi:hypothetical protein